MEVVFTLGKTVGAMRVNTSMIGSMATASTLGVTGDNTKGFGTREGNTVTVPNAASMA